MPICALPDHLKNKKHNDWPIGLRWIPRGISAKGPRCGVGNPGYLPWPPRLIGGFDVTRWEWCNEKGDRREIYIQDFLGITIEQGIYNKTWECLELTYPVFAKRLTVDLKDGWWPSVIPTTSEYGWLKLEPSFECRWRTRPSWRKFYWRWGARPDFDMYYNLTPYFGRNPE